MRFHGAFTFIYSKRSGTPAASRTDLVPRKTAAQRFDRLTATLYPIMDKINQRKVGSIWPVMVEEVNGDVCKGRMDDNTLVHFANKEAGLTAEAHAKDGSTILPGHVVPVKITSAKTFYVGGEV